MAQEPATPAESPAPPPVRVAQTHTSDLGFSYSLPLDWEVMDTKPMLPVVKQQQAEKATSEGEKKGIACVEVDLLARNGNPRSVIEAITIPFACFGQKFTDKDLAGVASGMSSGLKKTFEVSDPVYGAYKLGTHSMWIERANGTYLEHPEMKRTLETVCVILKKGLVCWMAMAADQVSLDTFERGAVTLDGESAPALVPVGALELRTIKMVDVKSKDAVDH